MTLDPVLGFLNHVVVGCFASASKQFTNTDVENCSELFETHPTARQYKIPKTDQTLFSHIFVLKLSWQQKSVKSQAVSNKHMFQGQLHLCHQGPNVISYTAFTGNISALDQSL
jgi:hypothetical protein